MSIRVSTFLQTIAASVALVCMPSCSGGGEPVTVNERMFLRVGDVLMPKGGGCSWTKIPSMGQTSSGGVDGDISVREGPEGDAFVVRVFSDQELLASRSYGVAMLNSGKLDEFTVSTHSNAEYLFRYWGGVCADLAAPSP